MRNLIFTLSATATLLFSSVQAHAQNITTIAGGGDTSGANVPALVGYIKPNAIAVDGAGNIYISDFDRPIIKKVSATTGYITRFAGNDTLGFTGDGGPATAARINIAYSMIADASGNVYFNDGTNHRIRKVNTSGIISTIAGNGGTTFVADGVPATSAPMTPAGLALDASGNLYFCDAFNARIRKINSSGIVSTIAGTGIGGYSGDGGPATSATMGSPQGITITPSGDMYFYDFTFYKIRKINTLGIISTVAGNGAGTYYLTEDGGPATNTHTEALYLTCDAANNIYFSQNCVVRKINTSTGIITRQAGSMYIGYLGDGGAATLAALNYPRGVTMDGSGNLLIADLNNFLVRKVNTSGIISSVAGNNFYIYNGDGGPAQNAIMSPAFIVGDTSGNTIFFDYRCKSIRKINPSGIITRVAGTGNLGTAIDGEWALASDLPTYTQITLDKYGNIYMADQFNNRIHKISAGFLSTAAGNGTLGFSGDGGPATSARLGQPGFCLFDTSGNMYIADPYNKRVRKVNTSGIISTYAGNGSSVTSGDSGPATAAGFDDLNALGVDKKGNLYVGGNGRIRKINAAGIINTVAGTGTLGYTGDGGPATAALIDRPSDIRLDDTGNIYFADGINSVIRKIDTFGVITANVGTGVVGFSGDGGPANLAQTNMPGSFYLDRHHHMFIADQNNRKIRFVCSNDTIASTISVSIGSTTICAGSSATFTAAITNGGPTPGYQWKINGTVIAGATASTFTTSTLGTGDVVTCVLTPNNFSPCAANNTIESSGITMTVTPVSPTPSSVAVSQSPGTVSFSGETITYTTTFMNGGSAPTFQWYINVVLVPGATANPFVTTSVSNGDHVSVTVRTTDPCANPDSASAMITTGISNVSANSTSINLYPNPNKGNFTINGYFPSAKEGMIEITNSIGALIYKREIQLHNGLLDEVIDINEHATSGIYFVRIRTKEGVNVYKFTVQ